MKRSVPFLAVLASMTLVIVASPAALAVPETVEATPVEPFDDGAAERPEAPRMSLKLSTYYAVKPAELTLTAEIDLPEPGSMKACVIQVDWLNDTGVGLPFTKREEIPCVKAPAEIPVPESFEKTVVLDVAGRYSYRLILEDREGKRHASASREIRVFEAGHQIRIGKTID